MAAVKLSWKMTTSAVKQHVHYPSSLVSINMWVLGVYCVLQCVLFVYNWYKMLHYNYKFFHYWLTWLMPCHCQGSIGHRPLNSIQLCLQLPPPSSSSCTWSLPFTFPSPDPFSQCFWVVLFLSGLVMFTVVLGLRCCHNFSVCVQSNFTVFFLTAPVLVLCQFSSIAHCWIFCDLTWLTWLMPCCSHSQWSTGHRPLDSIQLCLEPPRLSLSSCTWSLPSTFPSSNLFSKCSWVALFLCDLVVSTVVLAWQYCHQIFWVCV